jgi:5-methylcytosine-specific restriction endonuclease McrA
LVQFTIDDADLERLQYALQLLSHRNPKGHLAVLNRAALELLIAELENEKLGVTDDPRDAPPSPSGRHIPRAVRRQVLERDGWQCGYVSPAGRRCESRWMLEFDHLHEFARGGAATADNVRLLCRAHNQYAAECTYGAGFMEAKRQEAQPAVKSREVVQWGGARATAVASCTTVSAALHLSAD